MTVLIYIMLFMVGGCFGSAANCLIYRINHGMDWVKGRSVCENCGRVLKWYELVPVFSCLFLRGTCKTCGFHFGYTHAINEAFVGVASMLLYFTNSSGSFIGVISFWVFLLIVSYLLATLDKRRSKK